MANRYWVGGTGSWNDPTNHWATSDGGSPGAGNLPTSSDDVFITSSSGFGSGGTITVVTNPSPCNNFTANSGHSYTITDTTGVVQINGSATFESGITWTANTEFTGSGTGRTITSNGMTLNAYISFNESSTGWTLSDDLVVGQELSLYASTGNLALFDANDNDVTAGTFVVYVDSPYEVNIYMGSGTWTMTSSDDYAAYRTWSPKTQTGTTNLYPETSTLKFTDATSSSKSVEVTSAGTDTLNNLWFSGAGTGQFRVFNSVTNALTVNDLKIDSPPHTLSLYLSTTLNVSSWTVSGTSGNLITIGGTTQRGGSITNVTLNSGGTGYTVADNLMISGSSDAAFVSVASVGGSGEVTAITPGYSGYGYSTGTNVATTLGTGTGCTVDINTVSFMSTRHLLRKTSGTVNANYLSLTNSDAGGGANWFAGLNSTNVSNNTGWLFSTAPVDVSDSITVSDVPTVIISQSSTTIFDSITVTENTTESLTSSISVFETVTIADVVTFANTISVKEYIRAFDSRYNVTIYNGGTTQIYGGTGSSSEVGQQKAQSFVACGTSVRDVDVYTFSVGTPTDDLTLEITDSLGGTPLGTVTVASANISSFGYTNFKFSAPVAVSVGTRYYLQLSRTGARSTSNYRTWIINYQTATSEDIWASESLYKRDSLVWALDSNISTALTRIGYADNPVVTMLSDISKFDSATITESVSANESADINVFDSITTSDFVAATMVNPLSVFDTITVVDTTDYYADTIIVWEYVAVEVVSINAISVFDTITVVDVPTLLVTSRIDVHEDIGVTEFVAMTSTLIASVSDAITVSEFVNTEQSSIVDVFDAITTSEFVALSETSSISVFDAIVVTDVTNNTGQAGDISRFEAVSTTDVVLLTNIYDISVFDATTVTEYVNLEEVSRVSVSDSVLVSEFVTFSLQNRISVFGTTTVSEFTNLTQVFTLSVSDAITITEYIASLVSPRQLITSGRSLVASDTTVSASLEDIDGSSFTLTLRSAAYIVAFMSAQTSTTGVDATVGYAININGVDSPIMSRHNNLVTTKGSVSVAWRSGLLQPGTYTVKGRHRTDSGTLTTTNALLVAHPTIDDGGNAWPQDYKEVTSEVVSSGSLTDIPGFSISLDNVVGSHVWGVSTGTAENDTINETYRYNLVVGSESTLSNTSDPDANHSMSVGTADRTNFPTTSTPTLVKVNHAVTAGSATLGPATLIAVGRGFTAFGKNWTIPSGHVHLPDSVSTTSSTLEDIPGLSVVLDNTQTSHLLVHMHVNAYSTLPNTTAQFVINIDGVDHQVQQRTLLDTDEICNVLMFARTTTPVAPGPHTIKGRWATNIGTLNTLGDVTITSISLETTNQILEPAAYDTITVTDVPTAFITLFGVNVSESITVADVPEVLTKIFVLSVFDTASIIEFADPEGIYGVSAVDTITVIDVVSALLETLVVSVSDAITVVDAVSLANIYGVVIFDTVSVTEFVANTGQLGDTSVFDAVNTTDVVSNINAFEGGYNANIYEDITVTEFINTTGSISQTVFDVVTVSEFVVLSPIDSIFVYDSSVVSEFIDTESVYDISVHDDIGVSESVVLSIISFVSVFDVVTVADIALLSGELSVSVFDITSIAEDIVMEIITSAIEISVYDSITVIDKTTHYKDTIFIGERVVVYVEGAGIDISVFDSILVTEFVDITASLNISVYDAVVVTEAVSLTLTNRVDVYDAITVTEFVDPETVYRISVVDTITVIDAPVVLVQTLVVSVFDVVTVVEFVDPEVVYGVYVVENITVADVPSILISIGGISVYDAVLVTDIVVVAIDNTINVFDAMNVGEFVASAIVQDFEPVSVYDTVVVSENVSLYVDTSISVFDIIATSEYIALLVSLDINVFDSVLVSEYVDIENVYIVSVFDAVSVSEAVTLSGDISQSVYDVVIVSELVAMSGESTISVSDAITVAENVSIEHIFPVIVYETITTDEYLDLESVYGGASAVDLITIRERVKIKIHPTRWIDRTAGIEDDWIDRLPFIE